MITIKVFQMSPTSNKELWKILNQDSEEGARPNLFECVIQFPELLKGIDEQVPQDMRFMIKAG